MRINYIITSTFLQKWKNKKNINSDFGQGSDVGFLPGSFASNF